MFDTDDLDGKPSSKRSNLIVLLDKLSHRYLGTKGQSRGSWSDRVGGYTGGIFTGCKTSANHEIWERYLLITKLYLRDKFGVEVRTWSWPGSKHSFCTFQYEGMQYYDEEHKQLFNNLGRFESSLYKDKNGINRRRSFTDVLRQLGYLSAHDATFPGKRDGQEAPLMSMQFIMNAWQSRPDALIYPTNRGTIGYRSMKNVYKKEDFNDDVSLEVQMYDRGGIFHTAIETWRKKTANGIVWGEAIDSDDTWSERTVLEGLLKYGKFAGVEFITKTEAFDVCFNHRIVDGNLIYNPKLRNTAKEFMPEAKTVPSNPDGYEGNCVVEYEDGVPVLVSNDCTSYEHYGVPYGQLLFKADISGEGRLVFRTIKNNTKVKELGSAEVLGTLTVKTLHYESLEGQLTISDEELTQYEQLCGGWGKKVIALRIEYVGRLRIKNISLYKQ